jgi:acyl dehydratase
LLSQWTLRRQDGRVFALLTGDFNPVHWSSPYARAMGFKTTILHGFASMARVYAALEAALGPRKLEVLDLRFTRPVTLPGRIAIFLDADRVFVGAQGEQANVSGSFVATNPDRPLLLPSTQS